MTYCDTHGWVLYQHGLYKSELTARRHFNTSLLSWGKEYKYIPIHVQVCTYMVPKPFLSLWWLMVCRQPRIHYSTLQKAVTE